MDNEIIEAVREHAQKSEAAFAASALQVKSLTDQNAEQQKRLGDLEMELGTIKANRGFAGGGGNDAPNPITEFVKSAQLQALREGANSTGRISIKAGSLKLLTKAISNSGVGQVGDQTYNVQPERLNGLGNNPQRHLSLLDVLPSIPVSTGSVEYVQLNGYTNAAAVQAKEGDAKALATVPTTVVTASIVTVAHYVKASLQVLDDMPALSAQLSNLLSYGCLAKLENLLINGAGGTGQIDGLLTGATAFTASATSSADKIGQAITHLLSLGWNPGVIVLNPTDWFEIQSSKGTSYDGYLLGSPRSPAPPSLWSVPVVQSPSLAVGTALVLDPAQCSLLERQEVVMATRREDGSNFTTNMVSILAELRAGLMVLSPGAVLSVALNETT